MAALAAYLLPGLPDPAAHWPLWDVRVYGWGGRQAAAGGGALYAPGAPFSFTYPPFAAVLFAAFAGAPAGVLKIALTAGSLVALPVLCGQSLAAAGVRRRPETVFAVSALALLTRPVAYTLHLGEINLILAALIGADLLRRQDGAWWQGIGTGLAAGIKLTPLIFVAYLALTGRLRAAVTAAGAFALTLAAGFAWLPGRSRAFWLGGVFYDQSRVGDPANPSDQSLAGAVARLAWLCWPPPHWNWPGNARRPAALPASRGLTGQLRPLHAEPVIRWGFAGARMRAGQEPRGGDCSGRMPDSEPAMGGDLMAREWDVPGYTAVRMLGSGGFGEVMLARHDASGTQVAIKYLRRSLLADPEFAALFRAEAAVLASLDDQNVVRLYEYVESPAGAAIVMELVDGVSLRDILARQGKTTAEAALVVLLGSLLGLAAAHRHGVVHRDYKPENVLIDGTGASKLTDFGIAARAGESPIPAGTLAYAPPEQFTGSPASPATDVYAATATFYECLTGRPPFDGGTAEALLRQHQADPVPLEPVPEPLRPLVAAGLAKDPGHRPADGAALVTELRAVAGGAYGPDWEDRGRSALAAAALLLAALWPSGGAAAGGAGRSAVHRVRLRRRLRASGTSARPRQRSRPAPRSRCRGVAVVVAMPTATRTGPAGSLPRHSASRADSPPWPPPPPATPGPSAPPAVSLTPSH